MCLVNCPFAAIADKSQIFQIINAIKRDEEVIACVAPAFVGQFGKDATPAKLKAAMRILGFADVVEVAIGADLCTVEEAHDFLEEVPEKLPFMGTSCCPAWSVMAKKLFPEFKDCISMALTPMVITARMVKKDHPNARICFIGPCAAKKLEANRKSVRSDVDFVLTFEELQGMFDAKDIDFKTLEPTPTTASTRARPWAGASRWAAAWPPPWWRPSGTSTPTGRLPIEYGERSAGVPQDAHHAKAGKRNGYLLEGMACPGGCVAGAGHHPAGEAVRRQRGELQEPGGGGQHYRQPLPGPSPGSGGEGLRVRTKTRRNERTGPPFGAARCVRFRISADAHIWYSSTISGMVPMHSRVVMTLMAPA